MPEGQGGAQVDLVNLAVSDEVYSNLRVWKSGINMDMALMICRYGCRCGQNIALLRPLQAMALVRTRTETAIPDLSFAAAMEA